MSDLYTLFFSQVPVVSKKITLSAPDILGTISVVGTNGTIGTITSGVYGELNLTMDGQHVATIQDSVSGNAEIVTDAGTYTMYDNVYGGESLFHLGEVDAYSRPGLFNAEDWYDGQTHEKVLETELNSFGQTTITVPAGAEEINYMNSNVIDSVSISQDVSDIGDVLDISSFLDMLDFI